MFALIFFLFIMLQELFVLFLYLITPSYGQLLRISNGNSAYQGQFPYHVLIRNSTAFCGGSIIHKRWILTAAHCEPLEHGSDINVVVGTTQRSTGGTIHYVESFYRHEDFYASSAGNDIALIRLSTDIIFNSYVQPVQLPSNDVDKFENRFGNITGWGQLNYDSYSQPILANDLQYITVQTVSNAQCEKSWGNMGLIMDKQICTALADGKSPCQGDSGGPLVSYGIQIGIVSYADSSCSFERPTIFTRVSSFLGWIKYQLKLNYDHL